MNGEYVMAANGTNGDKRFNKAGGFQLQQNTGAENGIWEWKLFNNNDYLYHTKSNTALPPATGWAKKFNAGLDGNVPVITVGCCTCSSGPLRRIASLSKDATHNAGQRKVCLVGGGVTDINGEYTFATTVN